MRLAIPPRPSFISALRALMLVTIKPRKALPLFSRHPWVFSGAIQQIDGSPDVGDIVTVQTHKREPIGVGLFNPHSNIRVRLYHWLGEESFADPESFTLDEPFWRSLLSSAIDRRRRLFDLDDPESACRLCFSEADGLSGLTIDRYGSVLLLQLTAGALADRLPMFVRLLNDLLKPSAILLRTEKGMRKSEGLDLRDELLSGDPPASLSIVENGVRFAVDVTTGQKTGFYLDQRRNRQLLVEFLKADRVTDSPRLLDAFCYTGGFGITALTQNAAGSCVAVDVSETALDIARKNAEANGVSDRFDARAGKAFDVLEDLHATGDRFDAVVLDPPKMTRHRKGLPQAMRGYHSLNRMAVDLLRPGGLLLTCSCSGLVKGPEFESMLADVALRSGRRLSILSRSGPAADHPLSPHVPESDYLHCNICRLD